MCPYPLIGATSHRSAIAGLDAAAQAHATLTWGYVTHVERFSALPAASKLRLTALLPLLPESTFPFLS
jgi:hypothetical protein